MMKQIKLKFILACAMALLLSSCGGKIDATIGGTVTGLSGGTTLVLQDNGGDNKTINANGAFSFATQIEAGSTYNVTILTQPIGETCNVQDGLGVVSQSIGNVNSITLICNVTISASNSVVGTVTGLGNGDTVTLTDNGTNSVTVKGTTTPTVPVPFLFPALPVGTAYNVEVSSATGATCTAANNIGTVPSTTYVSITCH
jgi:hypothetical protein